MDASEGGGQSDIELRPLGQPQAASALATGSDWRVAMAKAIAQAMPAGVSAPNVLVLFASTAYMADYETLLAEARDATGAETVIGCSVKGFAAGDREVEGEPGLSLLSLWLPDATLHGIHLDGDGSAIPDPGERGDQVRGWFMLAEPYRLDALGLIQRLKGAFPGRTIVGGMASGLDRDRTGCLFLNETVYRQGAVALGIGGHYDLIAGVAQGCFPIGEPWTITAVERNILLGISNRPALAVLQHAIDSLSPSQRERAPNNVTVGLAVDEYLDAYASGDFIIRGILSIDPRRGSVAIGGLPRVGQTVQFHLREAERAGAELVQTMAWARGMGESPVAAIACTCEGRGAALFGHADHDAALIAAGLPGVPLVGAFCPGEIGPLGKTIVIHGFSATTGIVRRHRPPVA